MNKTSKDLIISLLMIIIVIGIIAYAGLYQKVISGPKVQGNAWDISLNNPKKRIIANATSSKEEVKGMKYKSLIKFKSLDDAIVYEIDIYNKGNINAKLNSIIVMCNENIDYKISGIIKGSLLNAGSIDKMKIKVYPKDKEILNIENEIEIYLEYVEAK